MFDKVYADLMTLVKSTELNKSSLEMNIHYEELLAHLESLSVNRQSILDSEVLSERSLYSVASKLNHRLTKVYVPVRQKLYESHDIDESILFPLVLAVGTRLGVNYTKNIYILQLLLLLNCLYYYYMDSLDQCNILYYKYFQVIITIITLVTVMKLHLLY